MTDQSISPASLSANPKFAALSIQRKCFGGCWMIVAAAALGLLFVLQPVWASKPDLEDKFLIPMACVWLVYRAWPRIWNEPVKQLAAGFLPLVFGAAAFAVGWFVVVQVSARPIVVWWLTLAFVVLTVGLALVHWGWRRARILIFPLLFVLFSLPTPGRLYNPLQDRLKRITTSTAHTVLPWLGVDVLRPDPNAFELVLESGSLGVVEACSGVRSITALTAIAVLIAYLRGFSIARGAILVGLTFGVVAITNSLRVVATGLLQENIGPHAIEGRAHDALGVSVILIGLGLIVGLSSLIAPRRPGASNVETPLPIANHQPVSERFGLAALGILATALSGCLWSEQFRFDHRVAVQLEDTSKTLGTWTGVDLPIPELVKEELLCDQLLYRTYRSPLGKEIHVWVMFWANAATTAHMHHPDICYPFRGWEVTTSRVRPIDLSGSGELPISVRHYRRPRQQQVLYFWTQHGRHVVADGIQGPERFSGHSWILRILQGHEPLDRGARISVLIGTESRGDTEPDEKLLRDFTRLLADELYRLCPWALPAPAKTD